MRILDPACGSGNFLYVALERLLNLEKDVLTYRANAGLPMGYPLVRPHQVLGLEINEYAHQLAQVAIWIGYLQWMIGNSFTGISEPVLDPLETIRLQDALLTETAGEVSETVWPPADFIIGNPPFLGDKKMRAELGDTYVDLLRGSYRDAVLGGADLCCYFFERARAQIQCGDATRAGLLATTTVRFGANRKALDRLCESGSIFMAWSDEPWILDGANVRISIVGFDSGEEKRRTLNGIEVLAINPDLTSGTDVTSAARLTENAAVAFLGVCKGGPFDISSSEAANLLAQPTNPNGLTNHAVVHPRINGQDVTGHPKDGWIVDFGPTMSEEEAAFFEAPFAIVEAEVKPVRESNRDAGLRTYWWRHQRPRPELRQALIERERFIVTPAVSKHRLFAWVPSGVVPDHKLVTFAREDDYFFGILHSRAHELWSLVLSSKHGGERPTYTPTTCFETFPLPWPPGTEPVDDPRVIAIGEAAANLDRLRRAWLDPEGATEADLKKRTLTNLYNQRPTWLQHAQAALDRAVWAAYGWDDDDPATLEDDTILARLLTLNLERAGSKPA